MEFILFYAMIVMVSLGYPAVSPKAIQRTTAKKLPGGNGLMSLKREGCENPVNRMIRIQCDSNGKNNICNATCDGNGNGEDSTVEIFTLDDDSACIQSYNKYILNVSDSKQVIFQPPQGRSCNDKGMVFPFLLSRTFEHGKLLYFFKLKSTDLEMMLVCSCESNSLTLKENNTKQLATNRTPLFILI
ncbi:uncharacterized protein [Montipora capricornis]|uniref:uncharacterized protein n=1 Tax=Montipora capricornis TaxID=246305 RepID=UPI0035F14340